jgi:hypothetical protein
VTAVIRAVDPDMPGNEPWLTLGEAGRRSGRHPDTLRAMIRRGRLEGRKGNRGEWLIRLPPGCFPGQTRKGTRAGPDVPRKVTRMPRKKARMCPDCSRRTPGYSMRSAGRRAS